MFESKFSERIQEKRVPFFIISILALIFTAGITFTFVVTGLKRFNCLFFGGTLFIYFIIANFFVELFKGRRLYMFVITLLSSQLGMGWRLWLEWGEFSLVEHMNLQTLIGYPLLITIIIAVMTYFLSTYEIPDSNKKDCYLALNTPCSNLFNFL